MILITFFVFKIINSNSSMKIFSGMNIYKQSETNNYDNLRNIKDLSLNNGIKVNDDKTIVLYVESINTNRKIVSFAQKPIFKKTQKVLFKLSSKLFFNFQSNSKYT